MSNVTYLSGWDASLCFQMNDGENRRCDLNRLLFKGYPRTEHIQQGKPVESAHRDGVILQFKERFQERLEEGASHSTLYDHYRALSLYLKWCDKNDIEAFLQHSIEAYMASCFEKVRLGLLKASTYTLTLSMISRLFQNYFDYPSHWFLNIPTMGRKDTESFEAYSRSDLRQLLPFLRKLFNQTTAQFLENPQKHINAGKCVSTMTFSWLDKEYKLCGAISKMMCAATYLMSYYTYSNASVIFQLKRPKNVSISVGEQWYQMPAFKRRSFKRVHLEMGGHNNLDCSGQLILATILEFNQNNRSDSLGVSPPLY
ncbi:hypothetical protein BEL05_08495 [Shewanella colwelliana]|uniref:Uncharacterized protein n=1 Tax=Shewanella colwelliana TaxID=23 RepID=A0A1E5IXZ9_SHECO|nr:hypothetical protein [Shewanella colwelliana]OEG75462.1 hypothetical protein BEL05_08495 [Shewanella colwelliana]